MSTPFDRESMMEMYIFETSQLLEQLESSLLDCERERNYPPASINEIFRIMHTIKGSSAVMMFNEISTLAHSIEDLFFYLRENKPQDVDYSTLSDLLLACVDFMKVEIEKIKNRDEADGLATELKEQISAFLSFLKQDGTPNVGHTGNLETKQSASSQDEPSSIPSSAHTYQAILHFDEGCEMENIRAFGVIHKLKELTDHFQHEPENLTEDESADIIRKKGFIVTLQTDRNAPEIQEFFESTLFLHRLEFSELMAAESKPVESPEHVPHSPADKAPGGEKTTTPSQNATQQTMISVNVRKLDLLMDMVGELVISEAMVTQNPDLKGQMLESFQKAARQHRKIIDELQDMVMSIRMVPLAQSFHKMHRIIRDMTKKLNKEAELVIIGEETEVDRNIIEHISDPLMHLIRNSLDHGVEPPDERKAKGKPEIATVTLEARNEGGEVLIFVRDDGRGLNREKIVEKAKKNGLLHKPEEEMSDKEIYSLVFLPGFSTKDGVSEFSGRGVGMDVVTRNIEAIGGTIDVDSKPDEGTSIILKIPLTLAIVNGMNIRVGEATYTVPTTSVKESFRASGKEVIIDPDGNEMLMIRGQCYPILRLHEFYKVRAGITGIEEGIMLMVEGGNKTVCLFADELIGEQQAVVKSLPAYIKSKRKIRGITGCTLLGDGRVSLILDIAGLLS